MLLDHWALEVPPWGMFVSLGLVSKTPFDGSFTWFPPTPWGVSLCLLFPCFFGGVELNLKNLIHMFF